MYYQSMPYLNPMPNTITWMDRASAGERDSSHKKILYIFCDLDGVIADNSHRMHYIDKLPKNYDKFYSDDEISQDNPIKLGIMLLYSLIDSEEYDIKSLTFLTGRRESCRESTMNWIDRHLSLTCTPNDLKLIMRDDNDFRSAAQIKAEYIKNQYEKGTLDENDDVILIDDDPFNCLEVKRVNPSLEVITFGTGRF